MTSFSNIATAATPELSVKLAMSGTYVGMPTNLIGTKNVNGVENIAAVEEPAIVVEPVEEGELTVSEDVIVLDVVSGQLNELINFVTVDGENYATVRDESGQEWRVSEETWALWYGEEGELEFQNAADRAWLAKMRRDLNLVAA